MLNFAKPFFIRKSRSTFVSTKQGTMNTSKIISKRDLAIKLSNGKVSVDQLSKKVEKTVNLWMSRNEVVIENGYLKLA